MSYYVAYRADTDYVIWKLSLVRLDMVVTGIVPRIYKIFMCVNTFITTLFPGTLFLIAKN